MVFWTWGRELEDSFDDANTQKLSRVITSDAQENSLRLPSSPLTQSDADHAPRDEISSAPIAKAEDSQMQEETKGSELYLRRPDASLLKLARIPVVAIFHRNDSAGRGVPHTFVSFLRQYPALPQVVVSIPQATS